MRLVADLRRKNAELLRNGFVLDWPKRRSRHHLEVRLAPVGDVIAEPVTSVVHPEDDALGAPQGHVDAFRRVAETMDGRAKDAPAVGKDREPDRTVPRDLHACIRTDCRREANGLTLHLDLVKTRGVRADASAERLAADPKRRSAVGDIHLRRIPPARHRREVKRLQSDAIGPR